MMLKEMSHSQKRFVSGLLSKKLQQLEGVTTEKEAPSSDEAVYDRASGSSHKKVWPADDVGQPIFIQQDNARTHILPDDPVFAEAVAETGLHIRLMQQPPNSPDLNALDLGFFRSLQSLTDCRAPSTIVELIEGVQEEFDEYEVGKLNRIFLSLQSCMVEVMNYGGGNKYKTPHLHKQRFERGGVLPPRIYFPHEVYEMP